MDVDDLVSPELHRKLDQLVHSYLSPKQQADLEATPLKLVEFDDLALIGSGLEAKEKVERFRAAYQATDETSENEFVVTTLVGEYLWRSIALMVADECERRRTGTAPRAKGMN